MLPLSDGIRARRFPIVTLAIIAANFCVWIFYELPHLGSSVYHASFYPCTVNGACHGPQPWELSWFTAMFMHGSWDHILGNMLFLAIFGKNVEDAFGHLRYLGFYIAGGFVACATQTAVTLIAGSGSAAMVPVLGASGAIAAVLGAYFVLYRAPACSLWSWSFRFGFPRGCSSVCGSSISWSKPTSVSPRPTPTAAASPSSRTSAASCLG